MKQAMKARDQVRLDALRSIVSAFNYRRIEAGAEVSDEEQVAVVQRLVKQRNDSIEQFARAGRGELVEKETRERDLLAEYLPAQKTPEEVRAIVREVVAGLAPGARDVGAVMKAVLPRVKGQADGAVVRAIVGEELASA
ncbi:MAG: GatB/YqeY domain-containing protein [Candidatus Eremiobacteraeota bacterium]|nr:GatB/YqeY domain-containing protein [Candidatus Eremiobacteraeota bacterium]